MEKRISQNDLDKFYRKELKAEGRKIVQERIETRRGQQDPSAKTIFLSHSHIDKTIVFKIESLFNKLNVNLYIDWMDKSLPSHTTKDTAHAIKDKIENADRFLFLATYHGLRSKWCNWELGMADTLKGEGKLAVLPIESKSGNWKGNEYLMLYPEMKIDSIDLDFINANDISIVETGGNSLSLENWLNTTIT